MKTGEDLSDLPSAGVQQVSGDKESWRFSHLAGIWRLRNVGPMRWKISAEISHRIPRDATHHPNRCPLLKERDQMARSAGARRLAAVCESSFTLDNLGGKQTTNRMIEHETRRSKCR